MIWITGDTHADFSRLYKPLPGVKRYRPTRQDFVIICGDFGGIWSDSPRQAAELNRLAKLPFTVLFLDGNHENYDMLAEFPVISWNGGSVQVIRDNVLHLMRGQVYTIEGKTFFTMGGAACHDIQNGVLDPADPMFDVMYRELSFQNRFFRIKHYSWWEQEMPSVQELEEGWRKLAEYDFQVDCILTHCAPTNLQSEIAVILRNDTYPINELTDFLQRVYDRCSYSHWFCGHYHQPMDVTPKFHVLYEPVRLLGNSD